MFVVNPTITVRLGEEELRRLDELAQRMGVTRSDVIRSLVNNFDETLRQEVDRERKRWMAIGFVDALELAITDPEIVLRFVRRNVDILGYPDFVIGMVRVRNRVLLFSHHDKIGHQLLQQVKSKVEEEVRREEAEIEREEDDEGDVGVSGSAPAHAPVHRGVPPRIPRVTPVSTKYKLMITNRAAPPIVRSITVAATGKSAVSGGGGDTKATSNTSVSENKKSAILSQPAVNKPPTPQVEGSNPQAGADGSGKDTQKPAGQGITHELAGDFVLSLVTHSYHKYRSELLRLVESIMGG